MFEHTQKEELNIYHFTALAAAVLTVAWDALPTDRDPAVIESKWDSYDYAPPSGGWSKNWWANYKDEYKDDYKDDYKDTPYTLEMQVEDALYDAMGGRYTALIDLIAECVYPEDPALAKRTISRRILTDEVLEEAWDMLGQHDPDTVLLTLYDIAYCEI
jgi:hypothetical protein